MNECKHSFGRRALCTWLCVLSLWGLFVPRTVAAEESLAAAQQRLVAEVRSLLRARMTQLTPGDQWHGLGEALTEWMIGNLEVGEDAQGGPLVQVPVPKYSNDWKGIPIYAGEEPTAYLYGWYAAVQEALKEQKPRKEGFAIRLDNKQKVEALDTFLREHPLAELDVWIWAALHRTKALGALSRVLLPLPDGEERWQVRQFVKGEQAPQYADTTIKRRSTGERVTQVQDALREKGYFLQKSTGNYGEITESAVKAFELAQGLEDDGVLTEREQRLLFGEPELVTIVEVLGKQLGMSEAEMAAWWPVYLQGMRNIEWTPPVNGLGPTLTYQAPAEPAAVANALQGQLIAQYEDGVLPRDAVEEAMAAQSAERMAGLEESELALRSLTVDLSAWMLDEQAAMYERLGAFMIASDYEGFARAWMNGDTEVRRYVREHVLAQAYPPSGVLQTPPPGNSEFALQNAEGVPLYARLYAVRSSEDAEPGTLVATLFVQSGDTVTIPLQPGYYHLTMASGKTWYGEEALFGAEGRYVSAGEHYRFDTDYTHLMTVYPERDAQEKNAGFLRVEADAI